MRPGVVLYFLGLLATFIGVAMLVPLGVSLYYAEGDVGAFALAMVLTTAAGLALWWPLRRKVASITRRESFAIVTLGWATASAFAALPFMFAGTFTSYIDAYFEAMSGFTTTGASVLANIEGEPHGVLLWRSFIQWLGGMGIIVLFVAVLPMLGVGAARMFEDEAPGPPAERLTPRIRQTAKALWLIYLVLSAAEVALLTASGLPLFDSVTHTFSTMATGGYSSRNTSVAAYNNPLVEYIITFFMAAAGVNFALYYFIWRRQTTRLIADREIQVYLGIIGAATGLVLFDLTLHSDTSLGENLRLALFQVVSIQTTTGFATANFDLWPPLSRTVLIGLMILGACAGSTGGGMKVIRIWVLVKFAHREIYTMFHPRAVLPLKLKGRPISDKVVSETVGFSILYLLLLAAATLFVTGFGIDMTSAFSAAVATVGNIGPGLGIVGPATHYAFLPDPVKVVLVFCMLAGRLEIWTLFVLLRPAFWTTR
ncbi:MAG: TrkH family potassium uptake protein [Chloroflexota bacterium]